MRFFISHINIKQTNGNEHTKKNYLFLQTGNNLRYNNELPHKSVNYITYLLNYVRRNIKANQLRTLKYFFIHFRVNSVN